jgi:hypothetical protein
MYSSLLSNIPLSIAETAYEYQYLTERHLHVIWFERKYFKNLQTADGKPIEIISPGIWNAEAGPDFLKAHLRIDNQEFFGDVEIHLSDESWMQHHHDQDYRYNNVIFHLSLWKPRNITPIITKGGKTVPQGHLENILTVPHQRILQLIDLDLYPYKKFVGSGKCAHALFRALPEEKISAFFKEAADWRLKQKQVYLQARFSMPELQLAAGFAMGLGYKKNTEAFLNLFMWLHSLGKYSEDEFLALSLQACGFFADTYQKKWIDSPKYQALFTLASKLTSKRTYNTKLVLNQIRPLNHPIRRLLVMAKLLSDPSIPQLYSQMMNVWDSFWKEMDPEKWRDLAQRFREMLPNYHDTYWNQHYTFETTIRKKYVPLMGEDLKNEILVNTVLPLLYAHIDLKRDLHEISAFQSFYDSFPAADTSKTRYLTHRFFGDTPKGSILSKARTEQGAYQLHRDFCLHYEASCEGCPFVERYKANFLFKS